MEYLIDVAPKTVQHIASSISESHKQMNENWFIQNKSVSWLQVIQIISIRVRKGLSLFLHSPLQCQSKKSFPPATIILLKASYVCVLCRFSRVQLFANPWTEEQVPWGFSGQEYWSALSCPSPGNIPGPGIKPTSPTSPALASRFFTTSAT